MTSGQHQHPRGGIVLLIALGMLSLFSVLIVSFIVFSSQQSQIAVSAAQQRTENIDPAPIFDMVVNTIVSGDSNPESPAFHEDLLGDLWGTDHLRLRVAHRRGGAATVGTQQQRGMLLQRIPPGQTEPVSTLFKFPIHLATWHHNGNDSADPLFQEMVSEVVAPLGPPAPLGNPPNYVFPANYEALLRARNLPDYRLNDVFAGRLITFLEGPLANHTFRVIRSFGTRVDPGATAVDNALAGCLVIDLAEMGTNEIQFNGQTVNLYRLASDNPNALLYNAGPDGAPGQAGFNDDGDGIVDNPTEFGTEVTDDIGYVLLMNGVPFNGRGRNASGANLVSVPSPVDPTNPNLDIVVDPQFGRDLLPNQRITGVSRQSAFAEPDEVYDAADFDNWYLAWQPSDHREVLPQLAAVTGLSPQSAPSVIPSYHRPSVVNYLMNAPIWFDENGDGVPDPAEFNTYANLVGTNASDVQRLRILYRRIRAACYRPLNFEHSFFSGTNAADLNLDGNPFDGAPNFTGSNPIQVLNAPIDTSTFNLAYNTLRDLATWLINGPWDVDNDGDGVADSLWLDFSLPEQTLADGTIIRPLVAPLIEDLDGRINLNRAGTWSQLTSARFNTSSPTTYAPAGAGANPDADFFAAARSLQIFGRGGGVGPAEIDFSHLFDEFRTGSALQPQFFTQTSPPRTDVLRTRYGNLLQSRYGGFPYDFVSPIAQFPIAMPGQETGPAGQLTFSDPLSWLIHPARRNVHTVDSPMGRAMDMHGRSMMRKDNGGNPRDDYVGAVVPNPLPAVPGVVINEVNNQPYEFDTDTPVGNDEPFTAAEFYSLVKRGTSNSISRRLVELLGDVADRNEAIDRLVSFDSRSLDVVELPGGQSIVQFVISRLPAGLRQSSPETINAQIERVVALELRKGSRLNLNRPLGNGQNDPNTPAGSGANNFTDETRETAPSIPANPTSPAAEAAFPQLANPVVTTYNNQANVRANYVPIDTAPIDTATPIELPSLTASELLARQLYYLMFRLILDPQVDPTDPAAELVPNFPYPTDLANFPANLGPADMTADVAFRNRYVAKRLAQWAVNAVDIRDTNAIMTRLRYDPNPFDNDGFNITTAALNVVWGMERRELELTETLSFHDRRVKRNLHTTDPNVYNPTERDADGEYIDDEADNDGMPPVESDSTLDQFRIPEASSIVELRSLRSPSTAGGAYSQESYPAELYDFSGAVPRLDLGRTVRDPGNPQSESPVWRMAVGYTERTNSPNTAHLRSSLWVSEAERMSTLPVGPALPDLPDPLIGLNGANTDHTAGDATSNWAERIRYVAEATSPIDNSGANPAIQDSQIYFYDDDLDPSTIPTELIDLERFVWFTPLTPNSNGGLNITSPASLSGMRPDNVFFASGILNTVTSNYQNVPALLEPGQFAVVLPRTSTRLGSTRESIAPEWPYRASPQRIEFFNVGASRQVQYFDLGDERGVPTQAPLANYRVRNVLPIVATALSPGQADPAGGPVVLEWNDYLDLPGAPTNIPTIPVIERVSVGFNISAPLSGRDYYRAPQYYINSGGTAPADAYPFCDGYRDYENNVGLHDDIPFDEIPDGTKPLEVNGWIGVGTYQDVATLFLQRLADPTRPWNRVDNPYITVDMLSMDLTVFNGEEDMNQGIDRDGDGNANEPVDPSTPNPVTELAFDTRRKIPDSARERPLSTLMPTNFSDLNDISNYQRFLYAQRSPLMSLQSVLRYKPEVPPADPLTAPYFNFELTSAWEDDNDAAATANLNTNFAHQPDQHRFDLPAEEFPQTLGFVNREFGEPAPPFTSFAGSNDGTQPGDYVGYPIGVTLLMPTHSDRPYQSPYELIQVPSASASRLNAEFSPGTTYTSPPHRETPGTFTHLLGFERNLGSFDPTDSDGDGVADDIVNLFDMTTMNNRVVNASTSAGFTQLTGRRAGFEQIFDLVDTGPISFGQRRWIDPVRVQQLATPMQPEDLIFNRVVSTLQPPFNYVDRHRTEGKINLNTMPDYVRQGAIYTGTFPINSRAFQQPLDAGERPDAPATAGSIAGIASDPTNQQPADPINSSVLFGNGSVYRALAWGHSTSYELDDVAGSPLVKGQRDFYKSSVDSRFGFGFKGFIESRRGYATSYVSSSLAWGSSPFVPNLDLDFRYPSRFAGMFAPAAGATLPSVQKYLRTGAYNPTESLLRRTHDMSLLRPHPDFDVRLMDDDDGDDGGGEFPDDRAAAQNLSAYTIGVETPPPGGPYQVNMPPLRYVPNAAGNHGGNVPGGANQLGSLAYSVAGTGLFERSQAELHRDFRQMSRDPVYRFENAARLANLTTHHSNVFMVRFTIGYFQVDPGTGALGREYIDPREGYQRPKGLYLIDRSIPVGYEPGQRHNSADTILFSAVEE